MPKQLQSQIQPIAAALGYMCDAVYRNPAYQEGDLQPLLIHCHDPATVRLVIVTLDDCYQLKHCQVCTEILKAKEAKGATFEILSEEKL